MLKRIVLTLLLIAACYSGYVIYTFSSSPSHVILAATTNDSYPLIPKSIGKLYLRHGPSPLRWRSTGTGLSALSFTLAGVSLHSPIHDVLDVFHILIACGTDVNQYSGGTTPLHEAVLFRNPEIVELLLLHGADASLEITAPSSKLVNMNARQVALPLMELKGKEPQLIKIESMLRAVPAT